MNMIYTYCIKILQALRRCTRTLYFKLLLNNDLYIWLTPNYLIFYEWPCLSFKLIAGHFFIVTLKCFEFRTLKVRFKNSIRRLSDWGQNKTYNLNYVDNFF